MAYVISNINRKKIQSAIIKILSDIVTGNLCRSKFINSQLNCSESMFLFREMRLVRSIIITSNHEQNIMLTHHITSELY
jgi:hypothetical protein